METITRDKLQAMLLPLMEVDDKSVDELWDLNLKLGVLVWLLIKAQRDGYLECSRWVAEGLSLAADGINDAMLALGYDFDRHGKITLGYDPV